MCSQDGRSLLHEAVIRGHAATVQSLIAAGACTEAENDDGCMPCDLAIPNSTCRSILVHHASVYGEVFRSPSALINAVVAHCPSFSMPKENLPEMPLSLRACHLEPSFLWAPPAARNEVFSWAQDAFIAQLATTTPPFAELPDDCCGDVLDFLDLTMTREELINVTTHCSSPEAQAWVHLVLKATIAACNTLFFLIEHATCVRSTLDNPSYLSALFSFLGAIDVGIMGCSEGGQCKDCAGMPQQRS